MADCALVFKVAVYEDGAAAVDLPVKDWRDVKAVHTVGQYEGAVRVLLADRQVRIYDGPSGAMVDVCVEMLSDDEKAARDKIEADAAAASVAEVHDNHVAVAQAQVDLAQVDLDAEREAAQADKDAQAQAVAEREAQVEAARKALTEAEAERDAALKAVQGG